MENVSIEVDEKQLEVRLEATVGEFQERPEQHGKEDERALLTATPEPELNEALIGIDVKTEPKNENKDNINNNNIQDFHPQIDGMSTPTRNLAPVSELDETPQKSDDSKSAAVVVERAQIIKELLEELIPHNSKHEREKLVLEQKIALDLRRVALQLQQQQQQLQQQQSRPSSTSLTATDDSQQAQKQSQAQQVQQSQDAKLEESLGDKYIDELTKYKQFKDSLLLHVQSQSKQIESLLQQIDNRKQETDAQIKSIRDQRRLKILKSRFSKTGDRFPREEYQKFEQTELKQLDVIRGLLRDNAIIAARNQKMERDLRDKTTLEDGLNIIEFEQLKIENQSLQEKIEDGKEELAKLQQKLESLVHLHLHLVEKLEYTTEGNRKQLGRDRQLNEGIQELKDRIPQLKKRRDQMRQELQTVKAQSGFLVNRELLKDFEGKVDEVKTLKTEVDRLKEDYAKVEAERRDQRLKQEHLKHRRSGETLLTRQDVKPVDAAKKVAQEVRDALDSIIHTSAAPVRRP